MMLCKHCGGYRHGPCEDCHDGECTMNCGPAMIDRIKMVEEMTA